MKFSCDRCQTRYSIGDEKVRGKVLKIRCKTCSHIIVVREQGASAAADQGAAVATAGARSSAGTAGTAPLATGGASLSPNRGGELDWYVAIKGKQHGPTKKDDVIRLFREGRITERSYLWNESMPQWVRLKDVPEFASLALEGPAAKRPPPPPVEEGAEIVSFEQARQQRLGGAGTPAAGTPSAGVDPFAAVSAANPDALPKDATRLFIMQAGLANRQKKHKAAGAIALGVVVLFVSAAIADHQGWIKIPGLHRVVTTFSPDPTPREMPIDLVAFSDVEEDPKIKCTLGSNTDASCVRKVNARNAEIRRRRAAGPAPSGPHVQSVTTSPDGFAEVSDPLLARQIASTFQRDGKGGPSVPKARIDAPAVGGGAIDAENVSRVIKDGGAAIQACVEAEAKNGLPGGKQRLTLTINPNGTVAQARFSNATQAMPVGECITKAARRWKFAPFPGEATDVEIPLILSVSM